MAYGNWGAFVYRNGERATQWEDATPYKEEQYAPGYHQAFGIANIVIGEDGKPAPVMKPKEELRPHWAETNHIDFDKANNAPANLEYVTHQQNVDHSKAHGRHNANRKGLRLKRRAKSIHDDESRDK